MIRIESRIKDYLDDRFSPGPGKWIMLNAEDYTKNIMAIIIDEVQTEIRAEYVINNYKRVTEEQEKERKTALTHFLNLLVKKND